MMKISYKKIVGIVVAVLLFYFIGNFAYKNWDIISGYNWSPQLSWLIPSVFLLILVYILAACGWILVIRMLGFSIRWSKGDAQ